MLDTAEANSFHGLPYVLLPAQDLQDPVCTVACCLDIRRVRRRGAFRQALRASWQLERHSRADILYHHDDQNLVILFHVLNNDKRTLDARLASIRRFLNLTEPATQRDGALARELDSYRAAADQGDPVYTMRDLLDLHALDDERQMLATLPPELAPRMSAVELAEELLRAPRGLICINGTQERCRYIIKTLWPAGGSPPAGAAPAAPESPLELNYSWPRCGKTIYSACLFPVTDLEDVALTLPTLLGGGHSFSSGGPGKGLFSRLMRQVLTVNGVQTAAGAAVGTRLSGFELVANTSAFGEAEQQCARVLRELAEAGPSPQELIRTKNKLIFALSNGDPLQTVQDQAASLFGQPRKHRAEQVELLKSISRSRLQR